MQFPSRFALACLSLSLTNAENIFSRDQEAPKPVRDACAELEKFHADSTLLPGTDAYDNEVVNVWDKRCNLPPACIFRPGDKSQVATALGVLHKHEAQFAVRGGGHLPYPGANSIDHGILIVLDGLKKIKVNAAENTIEVEPGNRWTDVYAALAPHGQYAIGGRLQGIGVPGVSLLGGVNYFLNKYGFTMDNIISYDVALGNGTQVIATAKSHRDLFWALKGSALNYGIVTKFILKTYNIPKVTSTIQIFKDKAIPDFTKATCDLVSSEDGAVAAGAVIKIDYNVTTKQGSPQVFGLQETTKSPPSRFSYFTSIPDPVTRVHNVTTPIAWHSTQVAPFQMFRISFGHHTIKPDAKRITEIYEAWKKALEDVADVPGLGPSLVLNLVPRSAATVGKKNGIGSTFGLDDDQAYIWWQLSTSWQRAEDDAKVTKWIKTFLETQHKINKSKGLATELLYGGDVAEYQNPLLTYPKENQERMRRIRDKYDPDLVFTRLNRGGFKLEE
ncbi:hypothetical protein NW762_008055 [Fusarium torreyae]|uniref:FAD-binding PCMH-type domain-containing protein n=1 Tax=Fusarium torreyae TaxID=1237075 RepID=A0A9W8S010_9HYPO|nr:hypothetical protein NW762_008055 [Fusarium torreyae]